MIHADHPVVKPKRKFGTALAEQLPPGVQLQNPCEVGNRVSAGLALRAD